MHPTACYVLSTIKNFAKISNIGPVSGSLLGRSTRKKDFGSFQANLNYRMKTAQVSGEVLFSRIKLTISCCPISFCSKRLAVKQEHLFKGCAALIISVFLQAKGNRS